MNLLKFPVMNPSEFRLRERNRRLYQMRKLVDAEEEHRRVLLEETGDNKYVVLQGRLHYCYVLKIIRLRIFFIAGIVDRTPYFESPDPEPEPDDEEERKEEPKIERRKWNPKHDDFASGHWCFDTPGTVNQDQVRTSV